MKTKRNNEGYLLMDHRNSPGVSDERSLKAGLPAGSGMGFAELSTFTCSHCQVVVVLNPLRTRERGYCPKCDHYVCDRCNAVRVATGECKTFKQIIEEVREAAAKNELIKEI